MTPIEDYAAAGWRFLRVFGLVLLALVISKQLMAQVPQTRPYCDTPERAIAALKAQFGELPAAIALDQNDRLITLYVDPADQSWTLLMTVPGANPVSCVMTGGESWESIALPPVGDPA